MAETEHTLQGDWDLQSCLYYNAQDGFSADDIDCALAVIPGERDGMDWRWLLRLKSGRYAGLQGACDYTGWDCQSAAESQIADEIAHLHDFFLGDRLGMTADRLYSEGCWQELLRQVREGVATTPRQEVAAQMGLENG